MKSRLIILLTTIVMLPSFLFGWLVYQQNQKQQAKQELILKEIVKSRLDDIDVLLQNALIVQQQDLGLMLGRLGNQSDQKKLSLDVGKFFINQKGELQYFDNDRTDSNDANKRFSQFRNHLQDHTLLYSHSYFLNSQKNTMDLWSRISTPLRQGWYLFNTDGKTQWTFWIETRSKEIRGVFIDDEKITDYLVAELNNYKHDNSENELITIRNKSNQLIFQKGKTNSAFQNGISEQAYLSPPLQDWIVTYALREDFWNQVYNKYQAPGFTLVFLVFLGLIAFHVYREQQLETKLAQQQMSFVNQVTHELQTPLTNIRMYSDLMEEQLDEEQKDQKRFMEIISTESQRLSRLIDNILDFARGNNKSLRIQKRPGHVEDVIDKCINIFYPGLKNDNFKIEYLHLNYPEVFFDPDVLEQILNNLIGNVTKYAKDGRYLKIEHLFHNNKTVIRVMDNGPGIPIKEQEKIFSPFYRYSNKLSEGTSGLGIGLDIARQLARLHGGDIQLIESENGCCFEVSLDSPLAGEIS